MKKKDDIYLSLNNDIVRRTFDTAGYFLFFTILLFEYQMWNYLRV